MSNRDMKIIEGLDSVKKIHRGAVVTIGNFDGVHLGHQKIIRTVLEEAGALGAKTMAITFDPHPLRLFLHDRGPKLLTPREEKARLMNLYGVDSNLFINFTREFASMAPEDFVRNILVETLGVRAVVVGNGYAFGKGKTGTTDFLRRQGLKYGFRVRVVRHATAYKKPVSSSRLRLILARGGVKKAADLLGRPYSVEGKVVKGAGRGKKLLDCPTANLKTQYEVIPKEGVYAVRVAVDDRSFGSIYDGVANIGTNPTFKGQHLSIETHLFGYPKSLLGKRLRIGFIDRIRDEITFKSPKQLKEQIDRDIEAAKAILSGTGELKM
jgi:riboflavin kinase/FMN adenylyltransferase